MATSLIELKNISKFYQLGKVKIPVLKNINLTIEQGSFLAILGPSGSGKSTLLNIISFLDVPSGGSVFFKNQDVSFFSEDKLAQVRGNSIGFVFQQFNLLHNMTALENVSLPLIFQGFSEKRRIERAKFLLDSFGLQNRLHHRPFELSGGEQQRVALSRALANDPDIIVADEPTGNIDSKTGEKIMEILMDLNEKQGKTLIMVTHDLKIAQHSKKIINILDGEIAAG